MYLFASEVRWGTSELTLFQKATTTTTKKKKTVRSRDMPPDANSNTALRPLDYLYIEVLLHEVLHEYREWSKNQCH